MTKWAGPDLEQCCVGGALPVWPVKKAHGHTLSKGHLNSHIDGRGWDNRPENLRFLCPNCHAQTDTFCSKNRADQKVHKVPNTCLDCGVRISEDAKRCQTCQNRTPRICPRKVERPLAEELKNLFGLVPYSSTRVGRLSGGWQQRLHLAVSLVHRPELLILDEPTACVDVAARQDLWRLIETLRAGGTAILLTTHQLDEAERLCNRIAIMKGGRIIAQGSVSQLLTKVKGETIVKVKSRDHDVTLARAQSLGWRVSQSAEPLNFLLEHALSLREVVVALDGPEVISVSVQGVSLEDAYLELLGEGAL